MTIIELASKHGFIRVILGGSLPSEPQVLCCKARVHGHPGAMRVCGAVLAHGIASLKVGCILRRQSSSEQNLRAFAPTHPMPIPFRLPHCLHAHPPLSNNPILSGRKQGDPVSFQAASPTWSLPRGTPGLSPAAAGPGGPGLLGVPGDDGVWSLPVQVGIHADHHLVLHGQPGRLPDGAAHGRAH